MNHQVQLVRAIAGAVLLLIHAGMPATVNAAAGKPDIKAAVVQVFTDSIMRDPVHPWQVDSLGGSSGSGVIIGGRRILTAAHVIDNSTAIYVRKAGSDKRYRARARHISDASELAILSVEDEQFFGGTASLSLGVLPQLGDAVTVWGFPEGGNQLAITKGIVSRIDFDTYTHSGFDNLVAQVDAAINSGASGGAAVIDGRLAGISFQRLAKEDADNVGYIIPVPVIEQFLTDIKDGTVHGVPMLGVKTQSMANAQLRDFFAMAPATGGVLVVETAGDSGPATGAIKAGDVLLAVDGVAIGNDGSAPFQSGDRIDARHFVTRHQIGDTIAMRVLRDKKEIVLQVELKDRGRDLMLVTRNYAGFVPDYEVVGGLVFQELTESYILNAFKDNTPPGWMQLAYDSFTSRRADKPEKAVFISSILADEINLGYEAFEDHRLARVNATSISNLDDLRRALAANEAPYHVLEFTERYGRIVLQRALVEQRAPTIRARYQLGDK